VNYNEHRNRKDLKSGRGWIYFIVGCLVALFLGGAVRVALSPKRIQNEIAARLERAKVNVAIDGLQVSLNDGIWPRFGFVASRTSITPKATCESWSEIIVENLYLPLGWNEDKLAFRTLEAGEVQIRMRAQPCEQQAANVAPTVKGTAETSELTTLSDRWRNEVTNFKKYLNQVKIHKVKLLTVDGKEFAFQNVDLNASQWPVKLNLDWMLSGVGWIQVLLRGHEKLMEMEFNSAVKEGQAKGSARLDLEQGNLTSDLDIQHWPLQHLVDQARMWGAVIDFAPKSTWLTCHIGTQTSWTLLNQSLLNFDQCLINGSLGTVHVEDLKLRAGEISKVSPFRLIVEKLDVRHLLQSIGREGLSGVSTEFGWLTGAIDVNSWSDFSWKGKLNDAVLHFSNGGQRAYQKISSVALNMQLRDEKLNGLLYNFILDQGEIQGQIRIDLTKDARNGDLRVQLPSIDFSKDVQKIMIDGQFKRLSIEGQMRIENGSVVNWAGDINAERIESSFLTAQVIRMKSDFADQKLSARASVNQINVRSSQRLYDRFKETFVSTGAEGDIGFKSLSAKLVVDRSGLQWSQMFAHNATRAINGYGFWQFAGPVSGEIKLDSDVKRKVKWLVKGTSQDWQLVKAGVDGAIRD